MLYDTLGEEVGKVGWGGSRGCWDRACPRRGRSLAVLLEQNPDASGQRSSH